MNFNHICLIYYNTFSCTNVVGTNYMSMVCAYEWERVELYHKNRLLFIVLYRHGIKCAITKVKHTVELKDRVLAPWGPSSISAVAELAKRGGGKGGPEIHN